MQGFRTQQVSGSTNGEHVPGELSETERQLVRTAWEAAHGHEAPASAHHKLFVVNTDEDRLWHLALWHAELTAEYQARVLVAQETGRYYEVIAGQTFGPLSSGYATQEAAENWGVAIGIALAINGGMVADDQYDELERRRTEHYKQVVQARGTRVVRFIDRVVA